MSRPRYRVLRLLAALGVLTEREPGSFGLTVLGGRLRSNVPAASKNSRHDLVTPAVTG